MLPKGEHDLRNHVHMDVLAPKNIKMFVPLQAANVKMVLGKLIAHRINVDERIDVTIKEDDVRRDIASGELGWAVPRAGALIAGPKGGCIEVIVVHDEASGAHNLKPMYDGLCAGKGIEVGISRELLGKVDVIGVPREEEDEGGVHETDKYGRIENGLPYESRGEDGTTTEDEKEEGGPAYEITNVNLEWKEMGNTYEAFMRPSTIGAERPLGRMAGARAIKTLTFWFN